MISGLEVESPCRRQFRYLFITSSCTNCGCVLDENVIVNNVEFVGNGEGSASLLLRCFTYRLVGQIVSENGSSSFTSASGRYS